MEGDGGRIEHSELTFGAGLIMVAQEGPRPEVAYPRSPKTIGGYNTQSLMVFVDDVDAHCQRARTAGATIASEPAIHDYGEDQLGRP